MPPFKGLAKRIWDMDKKERLNFAINHRNLFKGYSSMKNKARFPLWMIHRIERKNIIKGGYGDNLTINKIILKELDMGIAVEYEHTRDLKTSMDIVYDHLDEIPDYYTRLKRMEKIAETFWKGKKRSEIIKKKNK